MTLQFKVGRFTAATSTGVQNVTGVGFTPQLVLLFGNYQTGAGTDPDAILAIGGMTTTSQWYSTVANNDGTPIYSDKRSSDNACFALLSPTATPTVTALAQYSSMNVDGFSLNWATAMGTARPIDYVAIAGLPNVRIHKFNSPTATGSQSITGVGFKSTGILFVSAPVAGTLPITTTHANMFIGMYDGTNQRCSSCVSRDNSAEAYRNICTNCAIVNIKENGNINLKAAVTSLDVDGFTLNWTTVDPASRNLWAICLTGNVKVGTGTQKLTTGQETYTTGNRTKGLILSSAIYTTTDSVQNDARLQVGATDRTAQFTRWLGRRNLGPTTYADQHNSVIRTTAFLREDVPTMEANAEYYARTDTSFTLNWLASNAVANLFGWMSLAGDVLPGSGSISGKSGISGDTIIASALSGTVAGKSFVEGTLRSAVPISGSISGKSGVAGTPVLKRPISGTVAAQSGVSGDITSAGAISGSIDAKSGISGAIDAAVPLSGTVTATSWVSGELSAKVPLAGSIDAVSGVAGDTRIASALSGSIDAKAGVSGQAQGAWAGAGAISGQSSITGKATAQWAGAGTVAAQSGVNGNTTCLVQLSGSISAQSGVSGAAQAQKPLLGIVYGASVVAGKVTKATPIAGTISGFSDFSGSAACDKPLAGSIIGLSGVSGDAWWKISGTVAGASGVSGSAHADYSLAGTIIGRSEVLGKAIDSYSAKGTIAAQSDISGRPTANFALSGSIVCHAEITGTLTTPISGTIAGHSHISGDLRKLGVPMEVGWGGRVLIPRGEGVGGEVYQLKRTL